MQGGWGRQPHGAEYVYIYERTLRPNITAVVTTTKFPQRKWVDKSVPGFRHVLYSDGSRTSEPCRVDCSDWQNDRMECPGAALSVGGRFDMSNSRSGYVFLLLVIQDNH
jgi:hypothetical protein